MAKCKPFRSIDLDESAELVSAQPCTVFNFSAVNLSDDWLYLKLYNKASAATVGTDTPVLTYPVPAGGGVSISPPDGLAFGTGLSAGASTGVADNDTGAPGVNELIFNCLYDN